MNSEGGTSTLRSYGQEVEAELRRILAFWMESGVDPNGGFRGQVTSAGQIVADAPKGGVLNARILGSFSAAFRHTGDAQYRAMADRAYAYFRDHFRDTTYGGVYWSVDTQGRPLSTRKQIYGLAFAIYGLSEYYRATAEAGALAAAIDLFNWIEHYSFDVRNGGYWEAFSREGQLLDDLRLSEKDRNDPKTMNTHLHILEAYANLYRIWPDARLARQLKGLLRTFGQHLIDPQTSHMHLFFTADWQRTADRVSYGHDIEAAWLLLEAAKILGDTDEIDKAKTGAVRMARATQEGLQSDGSLYHELDRQKAHYDTHREWWVSAEAMVGFLNAWQLTGESQFLTQSIDSWRFIQTHILDGEGGEWRWGVFDDYSPMVAEDKIGFWKCPYHNTRACLEVAERCRRTAE